MAYRVGFKAVKLRSKTSIIKIIIIIIRKRWGRRKRKIWRKRKEKEEEEEEDEEYSWTSKKVNHTFLATELKAECPVRLKKYQAAEQQTLNKCIKHYSSALILMACF